MLNQAGYFAVWRFEYIDVAYLTIYSILSSDIKTNSQIEKI